MLAKIPERAKIIRPLDPETGDRAEVGAEGEDEVPIFTKPVSSVTIPPDKEFHELSLQPDQPGPSIIQTEDAGGGFRIKDWPADRALSFEFSENRSLVIVGRTDFVFYVPKGPKLLGAFARGRGKIFDDLGQEVSTLKGEPGYISLPVEEGRDGKFWRYQGMVGGRLQLLTVPPYMSPSAQQMLLPREVVEADQN